MNRSLSMLLVAVLAGAGSVLGASAPAHAEALDPTALCVSATPSSAEVQDLTAGLRRAVSVRAADGLRVQITTKGKHVVFHGKKFTESHNLYYRYDAIQHRARFQSQFLRVRHTIGHSFSRYVSLDQFAQTRFDGVRPGELVATSKRESIDSLGAREFNGGEVTWISRPVTAEELTTEQLVSGAGRIDATGAYLTALTDLGDGAAFTCTELVNTPDSRLTIRATSTKAAVTRTVGVTVHIDATGAPTSATVTETGRTTTFYSYAYDSVAVVTPTSWLSPEGWQRAIVRGATRRLATSTWTTLLDHGRLSPPSMTTRRKNVRKGAKKSATVFTQRYGTTKGLSFTYRATKSGARVTVLDRATKLRGVIVFTVAKKSTSWKATWPET